VVGTGTTLTIAPNAVTYAKMQAMTANKLLGSGLAGTAVAEITLGTGLSYTGTTLNVTGAPPSGTASGDLAGSYPGPTINTASATTGNNIVTAINQSNAGTIAETHGGTNQTTYATGDMLYATGANTLGKRTIGSTADVLTVSGGVPTWTPGGGAVSVSNTFTVTGGSPFNGNRNDFNLGTTATLYRLENNTAGSIDFTGIVAPASPRVIILHNIGAQTIVIKNQDAGSTTAANRFDLPGGGDILLGQRGPATFVYDTIDARWKLVSTN
jgi:hypothetical protein